MMQPFNKSHTRVCSALNSVQYMIWDTPRERFQNITTWKPVIVISEGAKPVIVDFPIL